MPPATPVAPAAPAPECTYAVPIRSGSARAEARNVRTGSRALATWPPTPLASAYSSLMRSTPVDRSVSARAIVGVKGATGFVSSALLRISSFCGTSTTEL